MWQVDPMLNLLAKAVDVAALRQSVHASNVANADVAGYRRLEVQFAPELTAAVEGRALDAQGMNAAATQIPELVPSTDSQVHLDQEMAQMSQNALRYQALLSAFEKTISVLRYAAREGREG